MIHAKPWPRATMLAAIFLAASAGGAAFGDETSAGVTILRGTPPVVQQPQKPEEIRLIPPALPSCPEGFFWSHILGTCYRPRDPLNPQYPGY
jgi:hypothetical protein